MSIINVGEVVYLVSRQKGRTAADEMLTDLLLLPITLCDATYSRVLEAAWVKSRFAISYADAFAAALAKEFNAKLVTGDPEFRALEQELTIQWLER